MSAAAPPARPIAHQARIRQQQAALDPRPPLPTLDGCTVERITVAEARPLIEAYEWLATMAPNTLECYGLWSPNRELLGAVSFGLTMPEAHDVCGREHRARTIALERGACVHYAPRNAASFLIRRAVKQAHAEHGWDVVFAYADESAGEIGTIYQALGWRYVGQGAGRAHRYREEWRKPGTTTWHSERILRGHLRLKKAEALARGWHHRRRPAKHRYVWFEDPTLAAACRYPARPYPKRARLPRAAARQTARSNRTCLVCATLLSAQRSTRVTCSAKCRVRLWRDRQRNGPRQRVRRAASVTVTVAA